MTRSHRSIQRIRHRCIAFTTASGALLNAERGFIYAHKGDRDAVIAERRAKMEEEFGKLRGVVEKES